MPQRLSQMLGRGESPKQPQNTRLRNLRHRIRSVQKSRPLDRRLGPSTPHDWSHGNEQDLAGHASDRMSAQAEVRDNDVVLNFQNMDQDCALRPVTSNSTINTSDTLDTSWDPQPHPIRRSTLNRPHAPDTLSAGHTRLTTDERGQLRYFGYSSLMRVVSVLPSSSPTKSITTSAAAAAAPEAEALSEIGEGVVMLADSAETHHYLMDLFFRYQDAALPMLDETAFREGYARGRRTEYYSTFLLHSLLLRALKFATLPHADQLRSFYLRCIRDNLLFEIENPSIATIPALCMFGSYMAGEGSDRACWLYPGLAFRLLYDFGLHEDCTNLVESGRLTEADRRIRHSILYHCFIFDKMYSSFQGRPTAIRFEDISCPLPSGGIPGSKDQLTAVLVSLSSILEDILPVINGRRLEIIYQRASIEKLSRASEKLLQWFKSLPPELEWNSSALQLLSPATCALHVHFLFVTILLNRPFAAYMLKSFENKGTDSGCAAEKKCLNGQTPEVSQKLCTSSGIRISKILLAYRLHHGASKFFSTINPACISASMALMSDIVSAGPGEDKTEEKRWLGSVLETLKEITPTYPIAGRSYMVLCAVAKACGVPDLVPSSTNLLGALDSDNTLLGSQHFQNSEELQAGPNEMVWGMEEFLGQDLYPMFDDVHDLGLVDFYPRLSPWPTAPDLGN